MRLVTPLLPGLICLALLGCSNDVEKNSERSEGCPDGERPTYVLFDIDTGAKGASSPRGALAGFLRHEKTDLATAEFDEVERDAKAARFDHTENGSRLAQFYVERLDRGWFVISYEACSGVL